MRRIVRRKFAGSLRVQLRLFEEHAVAVRKALTKIGRRRKAKVWGKMSDALRLVEEIERLARFGQSCDAEDAVRIVGYVEVLTSELAGEIDGI
jgi:hypothetical protein